MCSLEKYFTFNRNKKNFIVPSQFGKPHIFGPHSLQSDPTISGLHSQSPVLVSQTWLADPSGSQEHNIQFGGIGVPSQNLGPWVQVVHVPIGAGPDCL